ncbi:hypothetical protein J437_LFUL005143, partial [Ladona fulva]
METEEAWVDVARYRKLMYVLNQLNTWTKKLRQRFLLTHCHIWSIHSYSIEDLFPMSERQRIVHRQLHIAMRALSSEEHIPGHPKIKLNLGESIVQALLRQRLLDSQYILHDEEVLKKLGPKWYYSVFGNQPLEEVNTYFGEAVTLYFTFLGYYTKALCIPMFLGLLQIVFATTISQIFFLPFFCFFNVLWVPSEMHCFDENESTKLLDGLDDEEETSYCDDNLDSSLHFPHTYVVLKFSRKATSECIEWLARRIQGPRDEGGAELLVRRQPSSFNKTGPVILHISASKIKLLEVAEEMEVRVKDLSGREREFMLWKQKCSELAFAWGTIGMSSLDEPRPGFRGEPKEDPITGQLLPQYPRWKTYSKMYLVSIPIVLICLAFALYIMLVFFWVDEHLCRTHWLGLLAPHSEEDAEEESQIMLLLRFTLPLLPGCIYAALVYAMNWIYRRFATALTEWENHRTQSQFDRHRVVKLILFEFVNNFMALFYIAFYLQDMAMLKFQLGIMLIFLQLINNIQEALLPIWFTKVTSSLESKVKQGQDHSEKGGNLISSVLRKRKPHGSEVDGKSGDEDDPYLCSIPCLDEDDPRIEQAIREGKKYPYEGTYDDYLELFMQFGYVFLFASAYPAAAFWAVLNNYIEIRSDAFKLCHILQRPLAKRVKDTGAWQRGFEAMGSLSVMTNCAFLGIFIWKAYTGDTLSTEYDTLDEV